MLAISQVSSFPADHHDDVDSSGTAKSPPTVPATIPQQHEASRFTTANTGPVCNGYNHAPLQSRMVAPAAFDVQFDEIEAVERAHGWCQQLSFPHFQQAMQPTQSPSARYPVGFYYPQPQFQVERHSFCHGSDCGNDVSSPSSCLTSSPFSEVFSLLTLKRSDKAHLRSAPPSLSLPALDLLIWSRIPASRMGPLIHAPLHRFPLHLFPLKPFPGLCFPVSCPESRCAR